MRKVLISVCFILSLATNAQTDSLKHAALIPQRGIYLSYDEFVNNSPSVAAEFESTLIYRDIDTTVIGAQFKLLDTSRSLPIWGFCDGKDAFIAMYSTRSTHYWKLSFFGKNPYFLISYKATQYYGGPTIIGAIAGLITQPTPYEAYQLMMLNKNGDVEFASYSHLKRLFVTKPGLLKNFKQETNISDKLKKQYLKKFNFE